MGASAILTLATCSCFSGRVARWTGWKSTAVREEPATRRTTTSAPATSCCSGTSPRMAHSVLLQHNYRRNHRSGAKHRGIAAVLEGWYAHYLLDDLQEITRGWYVTPLYPGRDSTKNYLDTGELSGLVTASTSGDSGMEMETLSLSEACGGGELPDEDEDGEGARRKIWGTVDGLTPAARYFARMQGGEHGERPATGVETQAEKQKFDREVLQHLVPRVRMQQNHHRPVQIIDFSAFADSWNRDVVRAEKDVLSGLHERGKADDIINRKTAGHLQHYWTESKKNANIKRTMESHNPILRLLRQRLAVQPATREAAQEDGREPSPHFGMTQSGQIIVFPKVATARTTTAGPAPCAFARDTLEPASEEASDGGDGDFGDGCEISVGGGPVGEMPQERTWSTAAAGDPAFVTPAQACSSYKSVVPRFGIGGPTAEQQRVWNPSASPSGKSLPVKTPRQPPRCRDCGHYKLAVPHPRTNKKGETAACRVPENERREPDFSNRSRNRYDTSKPCPCTPCTAYLAGLQGDAS
ncbi:unnamed protein product [Ectocarpus sp. 13 AM-2016]